MRFILGDQLAEEVTALADLDPARDVVLLAEVQEETRYVWHHRQKIVLVLAAMRHFAAALRARGISVDYVRLDAAGNSGSLTGELGRAIARHRPDAVVATEPGEWRVLRMMQGWQVQFGLPVEIREDRRFLCPAARFRRWAAGRGHYRMEFFYREMRRMTGLLMEGGKPAGGRWNFDAENRKRLPAGHLPPRRRRPPPDAVTQEVLALVARLFPDGFGALEEFAWPVTRDQALAALRHFIGDCLPRFGDYQDAMQQGDAALYHSLLSSSLNIGLLSPLEVCRAAEAAWQRGEAPIAAVEGFIRQILGWREYMRGIYWLHMPDYAEGNALDAQRPLPGFYWTGETAMNCIAQVVGDTIRHGYAHHIQRLMVTGNFALLAGIAPREIEAWYLAVYVDAYDWVELPNTHGMAIFADGGLLASKPYAAGGGYIDRMSNYCRGCRFNPKQRSGADACPFTTLYWHFLLRHRDRLGKNQRLALAYRALDAMAAAEQARVAAQGDAFLASLGQPGSAGAQQLSLSV